MTGLSLALPEEQSGFAGKERLLAAMIDNLLAAIAGLLLAKLLPISALTGPLVVGTYLAYFFLFEWLWSKTPGKALFHLRVETIFGEDCTGKGALVRTLFRIVEVNPILLGALPGGLAIITSSRKQRLGDRFGGAVVVRKRAAKEASTEPAG